MLVGERSNIFHSLLTSRRRFCHQVLVDGKLPLRVRCSSLCSDPSKLTPFRTKRPGLVTWYTCGPTVYDSAHIGHVANAIRLDAIRRVLTRRCGGLTVLQAMSITDIDDKLINRANEVGQSLAWNELARREEAEYKNDMSKFGVAPPDIYLRVTQHIPHIQAFISKLLENGLAYTVPSGSVYMDMSKAIPPDHLGIFHRIDRDNIGKPAPAHYEKRLAMDFALWKAVTNQPGWTAPWADDDDKRLIGRPGWHIECSAMSAKVFGRHIDIHSGGADLKFPHHDAEVVQSRNFHDIPDSESWVSHWLHTGALLVQKDEHSNYCKMSKSLGNFVTAKDLLSRGRCPGLPSVSIAAAFKLFCLAASPWNASLLYTSGHVQYYARQADFVLTTISRAMSYIEGSPQYKLADEISLGMVAERVNEFQCAVTAGLADNFQFPVVFNEIMELCRFLNSALVDATSSSSLRPSYSEVRASTDIFLAVSTINSTLDDLGLLNCINECSPELEDPLLSGITAEALRFRDIVRANAKSLSKEDKTAKQAFFTASDQFRAKLSSLGIAVQDNGLESSTFKLPPSNRG